MHRIASAVAVLVALALPAGAHAAPQRSAHAILTELAGQVSHGWRDDRVPLDQLERRLVAGKRLAVTCGVVTLLARRALARAGIDSRVVATMTRDPYGDDNGHTMLELRAARGWEVWDLDNNRRAVDADGHGVPIAALVAAGRDRRWQRIADDPALNLAGASPELMAAARGVQADLDAWYDHVFGVPLIETAGGVYAFADDQDRARLEAYSPHYDWVTPEQWEAIQAAPQAPALDDAGTMVPARITGLRWRSGKLRYRLSFATTVRLALATRSCPDCRWRRLRERTTARRAGINEQRLRRLRPGTYRIGLRPPWGRPVVTTVTVR